MSDPPPAQAFLPARRAPFLYLTFAHACLFTALVVLARRAPALGGFYYHPRLIGVVHLVTLGFLTSAILGALYLVCPLALRMPLPERRRDTVLAVSWMIGTSGVASHFWLERYTGLAWAGGMALLTPLWLGTRVLRGLRRAPVPPEVRLPIGLALSNLFAAGALGVGLAVNKYHPFLPVAQLDAVHAHLHLAAVGFAALMVVGAGLRMLPMALPAAMPRGGAALAATIVIEAGTLGLAAALLAAPRAVAPCAVVVVAGIGLFLSRVAFMLRNRRPPPKDRPRPDWPLGFVLQALVHLVASAGLGVALAVLPPSDLQLRLAMAYGVCGLLGFFGSLVIGIEARIVPLTAWLQGFASGGYADLPPSAHTAIPRTASGVALALWTPGVPLLALGLALDRSAWTSTAATLLAAAVAVSAATGARAVRRLRAPVHSAAVS
jgi:hypothetical protein